MSWWEFIAGMSNTYLQVTYTMGICAVVVFVITQMYLIWVSVATGRVSGLLARPLGPYRNRIRTGCRRNDDMLEFIFESVANLVASVVISCALCLFAPITVPVVVFFISAIIFGVIVGNGG